MNKNLFSFAMERRLVMYAITSLKRFSDEEFKYWLIAKGVREQIAQLAVEQRNQI